MNFAERYGPWALVTGASAGIGWAFAVALAARGLRLVLVARRADRLEELAAELEASHGAESIVAPVDLTSSDSLEQIGEAVGDRQIGLLVNNAGFGWSGKFLDQVPERMREMVRLNCEVPALTTARFLPPMIERGRGGLITVSSVAGHLPTPYMALYGATKAFDLHLGEGLAGELRGTGVDSLSVCPGHTESEFHQIAGAKRPVAGGAMTAERVVEHALASLGRRWVAVPGGMNKMTTLGARIVSRGLATRSAARALGKRHRKKD